MFSQCFTVSLQSPPGCSSPSSNGLPDPLLLSVLFPSPRPPRGSNGRGRNGPGGWLSPGLAVPGLCLSPKSTSSMSLLFLPAPLPDEGSPSPNPSSLVGRRRGRGGREGDVPFPLGSSSQNPHVFGHPRATCAFQRHWSSCCEHCVEKSWQVPFLFEIALGSKGAERLIRPDPLSDPVSDPFEAIPFLGQSPHVCGQALRTTRPNSLSPQSPTVVMQISLPSKQFSGLRLTSTSPLSAGSGMSFS